MTEESQEQEHILEPGELFADRYEVERRIGIGGFGSVYRAKDKNLRREVALKVLDIYESAPNPRAAQQIRKRFDREAMVAGTIQHPSVVQVFDAGSTNHHDWECLFLVMELLEGWNLEDHLYRFGRFEPSVLLPLFTDLLKGVAQGHRRQVIHKDLKPGNIFYHLPNTPQSRLVVFDFGIARIMHEERFTATGHLVGTPQYLAPEYILDQTVSPEFDVYQLGLILCELLTARPVVLPADTFIGTCQAHVSGLELPEAILNSALGPIVLKACAQEPRERYSDASEFAAALGELDATKVELKVDEVETPTAEDRPKPVPTLPLTDKARDQIRADRAAMGRSTELFSPDTAKTIRARLESMRAEPSDDQSATRELEGSEHHDEPTQTVTSPEQEDARQPSSFPLAIVLAVLVLLLLIGVYVFWQGAS